MNETVPNPVVSPEQWLEARVALLEKEKEFTRLRDELSELRRQLPWVEVSKEYRFQTESGEVSLGDLFANKGQLMVYHFMFGPDWAEGCPSCSFWADGYNGTLSHLAQRDVNFVTISRAPLEKLLAYRKRMGWSFPWVSSLGSDFNFDFQVSFTEEQLAAKKVHYNYRETTFPCGEAPGVSVFRQVDGKIYHTYSTYSRGLDILNSVYHHLDLTSKGRDEKELAYPQAWVKRHDQYGVSSESCCS